MAESGVNCLLGQQSLATFTETRRGKSEAGKKDEGMSVVTNIQTSQQQSRHADVSAVAKAGTVETDIPARLDSLPWSGFHTLTGWKLRWRARCPVR
jgi:hypothetical protein